MATIGKVSAVFTASTSGLVAGTTRASSALGRLQASVDKLRGSTSALVAIQGAQMFAGMASTAGRYASQLVGMGQAQAETIDAQSKMARRLGMSMGAFQGLALAGDLAGVSMDTVGMAATKADVALVKAGQGSATAQAAFSNIGLAVSELSKMDPAARFVEIGKAIDALPSQAEKSATAMALFGRSGAELLPLFEGIEKTTKANDQLKTSLNTNQGNAVEAMNDSFTMAGQAINGIVNQVTAHLAPGITAVADTFTKMVGQVGGATIGQTIGDGIMAGAKFLAGVGDSIINAFTNVGNIFASVGLTWSNVGGLLWRAGGLFQMAAGIFQTAFSMGAWAIGKVTENFMGGVHSCTLREIGL
jgi:hypothetical protein